MTVPPGAEFVSDPVEFPVKPLVGHGGDISSGCAAGQGDGASGSRATSYYVHGDFVSAANSDGPKHVDHWYQISEIDVRLRREQQPWWRWATRSPTGTAPRRTETIAGPMCWPQRLQASANTRDIGVSNQGIGGNHLLTDGLGPNALARFDRDVLAPAGVRWVIVFEGVNDLGGLARNGEVSPAEHAALVQRVLAAYQQIDCARACARPARLRSDDHALCGDRITIIPAH